MRTSYEPLPDKFAAKSVEINLTFYRSLAGALKRSVDSSAKSSESMMSELGANGLLTAFTDELGTAAKPEIININMPVPDVVIRPESESSLAGFLSDDFMASLVCGHFHIRFPSKTPKNELPDVSIGPDAFAVSPTYLDSSIAAIECTVFRSGYVAAVLRLQNITEITATDILHLMMRPDQLSKAPLATLNDLYDVSVKGRGVNLRCGALNLVGYRIINHYCALIDAIIIMLGLECANFKDTAWSPISKENLDSTSPWGEWSRPYVGVIFPLQEYDFWQSEPESDDRTDEIQLERLDQFRRFVIASGRTTPNFLTHFFEPGKYLDRGGRNVYGDGGSMVFIGSRGWAVCSAANHNVQMFRLAVVEMCHFVIMALESSLRARRRFYHQVRDSGAEVSRELNSTISSLKGERISVRNMWRVMKIKASVFKADVLIRRQIRNATEFIGRLFVIAPFDDGTILLESHLKTHTARAAALRYKRLKFFGEADEATRHIVGHYVAALNSAASYISIRNLKVLYISAWIILGTLIVALISIMR